MASTYTASDIEVLEGLEPVRKRPGMFIAGTDTPAGLHQLVLEILDNSVDEAMNGYADRISVTLHADRESVTVTDNGRGIPVEKHPKFQKSALELILTTLHAGGKFSDKNYKTAGGLHGVGSSVVNALSVELIATVKREGKLYTQAFSRGVPLGPMKAARDGSAVSGTSIFFRPDPEIFARTEFSPEFIRSVLCTKAYLNPGLGLTFVDERAGTSEEFCFREGLVAYLKRLIEERKAVVIGDEFFSIERDDEFQLHVAFAWTEGTAEEFRSFANGIETSDGGSHEAGARNGIVRAVRNYFSVHDIQLKGVKIGAEDIREGLICLTSVKLPGGRYQAQFQGQTKSKLNNPEVTPIVESAIRSFEQILNDKPRVAQAIAQRIQLAAKARAASRAAVETVRRKVGISHRLTLPGKLADCSSTRPEQCELFIVEGDSAGGSTKQGRDRHFQAVLPLRGKVLNAIAASTKKIADNAELGNVVSALGCGVGDDLRLDRLRYGKVIILTDADADGMHIATLLMAFFFQRFRPLIAAGHLYLGKPPLYGVFGKGVSQDGRRKRSEKRSTKRSPAAPAWAYSDAELEQVLRESKLSSPRVVRYKGLGEMNPETLAETTLSPKTRTLLRVKLAEEEAVERALQELMGSDSSTRYRLIQENAEKVEVDI